ncbi:MAG: GAF domain-containing protein, partial [Verrucomicrobia bacterium]|nr:GAF domain-containing protein [Verrucomicrobiota bacterium]
MKFKDLSIERKLTLIITVSTALALVIASSILITRSAHTAYEQMIEDLATLADIIGNTSKAALSFRDATDAEDILGSLRGKSTITAACLYDANNRIFAIYSNQNVNRAFEPPLPQQDGYRIDKGRIIMFRQVRQNEEILGTLYLEAQLLPLQEAIRRNILQAILITIGSILLASLLASRLQHLILRQINRVVQMANAIARGELPEHLPVGSNDEIGELQQSFNQMIDTTRDVVRQTQTLAHGDYSITIEPRSENDELSLALIKMTEALKAFHEESRKQNWIKTGLGELYDRMRGEQKLEDLLNNILSSLAEYLDVQVGALFLADEEKNLQVAAGYAYSRERHADRVFQFGEGLVGQAAKEKKLISAKDETGTHFVIKSGLVDTMPRHVVVLPLIREDEVIGVLELGTSGDFNRNDLELLELAGGAIAIAIYSAQSRMRLNALLERTQEQSEKLREQQRALQKTNEELEERTDLLEQQKQEIHRSNHDLETARMDLERKARELATASQYKSEFLANMSHELRTPLNSLLILSRLLIENREGNLTDKQIEFAKTINKSGADLLSLINDILDLSKVEAGKLDFFVDTVAVTDICASMQGMFHHVAEERGVDFHVVIEDEAPRSIRTDPQRVSQILRNLLSNAFKFTPQGAVSLRVHVPSPTEFPGAEGSIAFAVVDSGIGIAADKQEDIFHAFQQADGTTSREYGGTGLGLSISRELAVRLGGNIGLESSEGSGSTFTLYLPPSLPA